jgi:RecJ-like exonuclease
MDFLLILLGVVVLFFGFFYLLGKHETRKLAAMSPEQRATYWYGKLNEHLICPHCQTKGLVRVQKETRTSTTTGKVGGILKADITTETVTAVDRHRCGQCKTIWDIDSYKF